jgi:hypothetical protein
MTAENLDSGPSIRTGEFERNWPNSARGATEGGHPLNPVSSVVIRAEKKGMTG